jgi:cell division septum initiation protein DivIVA
VPDPRTIPISSHPNIDPDAIAGREFPVVWRGYDPEPVHRFLVDVSQLLRVARARQQELSDRLADAERRAAEPELDEATISAALGNETARVLHVAHAAANEVLVKAEARAAHIVAEAEAASQELRHRAEADALAIVNEARVAANATIEDAKADCRAIIDESREVRRRVLSDLAERRKLYYSQIEQLRAGKDTLATVIAHVAETVATVQARLEGSEDDARAAAEVARRATESEPAGEPVDDDAGPVAFPPAPTGPREADREEGPAELAEFAEVATGDPFEDEVSVGDEDAGEPGAGPAGDPAPVAELAGAAIVDELFARIRESSAAAAAQPVATTDPADAAEQQPAADRGRDEAVVADELVQEEEAPAGSGGEDAAGTRAAVLRWCDEHLGAPRAELVHVLKRELRVEQNELMNRLREAPPGTEPSTLSQPTEAAQRFAEVASEPLAAAWREGARFAAEQLSPDGEAPEGDDADDADEAARAAVGAVALSLGSEIATSIAGRLAQGFGGGDGDAGSLQQAAGAAYHDWRAERIEETAGDYVTRVFALGTLEVARTEGARVSWVVGDGTSGCSDCDDNELAGPVGAGAAFPTGQAHPPAHGGCRCLLVPAGA